MDSTQILEEVDEIFKDELDNDDIVIKRDTTAGDIAEWDSLTHITLVVAIEKHFKVKFTAAEIQGFKNVGEMCDAIHAKVS